MARPSSFVLGPTLRIDGDLKAKESVTISGQLKGKIEMPTADVTVTEKGVVNADILGRGVTISGTVRGDVKGVQRVELTATANLQGKLKTREVRITEGAIFRGRADIIT